MGLEPDTAGVGGNILASNGGFLDLGTEPRASSVPGVFSACESCLQHLRFILLTTYMRVGQTLRFFFFFFQTGCLVAQAGFKLTM